MKIVDLTSTGRIFLSVGTNTRESEELILNESQILRTFDHPNIVQLECTFIEDSYLISCLEYLDSDDLYSYVTRYAMNTKQIQNLFCQLCSAVSYCHSRMVSFFFVVLLFCCFSFRETFWPVRFCGPMSRGWIFDSNILKTKKVVHGDLKCENILIRKHDKHLKVIDFGFSRCLRDKDGMLGVLGRTTQYAPPQDLHLTFAWDSWSVGVILFVMLKQRPPFALNQLLTGQMEDIVKTAKKVGNGFFFFLLFSFFFFSLPFFEKVIFFIYPGNEREIGLVDWNLSWIFTLWFFLEQVFDILMSLWELDFRRRKLIVDLMSESPWLRETQHHHHHHHQQHHHHHHHHQQRERKDTITATATTPSSFSKPHSVQHYASCSSLMSFPPFLELPPPIVASTSCTPPNCFEEKKSLSFPQIASSPRSFILFEYAASGSSPSERFFLFLSFFPFLALFPFYFLFEFFFNCLEIELWESQKKLLSLANKKKSYLPPLPNQKERRKKLWNKNGKNFNSKNKFLFDFFIVQFYFGTRSFSGSFHFFFFKSTKKNCFNYYWK